MPDSQKRQNEFIILKIKYAGILEIFLKEKEMSEVLLNTGYQFGCQASTKDLGILSIVSIHHDCLVEFLEKLETRNHLEITSKAGFFLEKVLSSYHMKESDFGDAIDLLNKRSFEFAVRLRELQDSLKEKEILLKEIYHRVKNNLQVISSLLHLQTDTISDPFIQQILIGSASRVKSMALVHEMLYQSGNLAVIEMDSYMKNIFNYLYEIYHITPEKIKYTLAIEPTLLSIEKAIPCGLIMNELISNIFKHAFPNNKTGEINLTLNKQDNSVVLIVSDNGVGIPSSIDIQNTDSLGMQLICNLTKQLSGNIAHENTVGTTFTLKFSNDVK
jgi:two-component sensor histidine kinase